MEDAKATTPAEADAAAGPAAAASSAAAASEPAAAAEPVTHEEAFGFLFSSRAGPAKSGRKVSVQGATNAPLVDGIESSPNVNGKRPKQRKPISEGGKKGKKATPRAKDGGSPRGVRRYAERRTPSSRAARSRTPGERG